LAGNDECRGTRCLGACEKSAGGDDHNQQGEHGDQIDLAGIVSVVMVPVVVDSPAHWSCPPDESIEPMRLSGRGSGAAAMLKSLGSSAAEAAFMAR
jgi:hypothetical protein